MAYDVENWKAFLKLGFSFFFFLMYLFIWLSGVLIAASGNF